MIIALLGILLGVAIGLLLPLSLAATYSLYVSVGILAAIDSVFGGVRASMMEKFDPVIFISGFFINALMAGLLAYIGDNLGVPLYYAAIFAFGVRLFNNLAIIRRIIIENIRKKRVE
ncbi:small basic family protein [Helicovermis profundi]|uniref:Small basic protein n=1 Tax=Helicovermis profundi TaxID=3065157 RepID=A0AAU9EDN0_9FIRM|nr:hypothetical protein HLPR_18250 [Clostridia bacterium S502]